MLFSEIEAIADVPKSEAGTYEPPSKELRNIALGKIPFVIGRTPENIECITDGKFDNQYATHATLGENTLQFEYKNTYQIQKIIFKLQPVTYKHISVDVSTTPYSSGKNVYNKTNVTQTV